MSTRYDLRADQELPALALEWKDRAGDVIDFSSGWTATVKVVTAAAPTTVIHTKTSGITLAATSPNYLIDWSASDMSTITAALTFTSTGPVRCLVYAYCKRDSDSKDRLFNPGDLPAMHVWPAPS